MDLETAASWRFWPFGLTDCSFEADGRRRYTNAAELLVRQNQKEETIKVFSFLAHMELN